MPYQDEESLKLLIHRYEQKIYALVLYLIGGNRDKAYDIAAASFIEAIRSNPFVEKERDEIFLISLIGAAVQKSRDVKVMPSIDESDLMDITSEERKSLRIVKIALQKLPFNTKALLLLRDQLHIPYRGIATILRITEKDARIQTTEARTQLRKNIEKELKDAR